MGQTAHEKVAVLIKRLNWLGFSCSNSLSFRQLLFCALLCNRRRCQDQIKQWPLERDTCWSPRPVRSARRCFWLQSCQDLRRHGRKNTASLYGKNSKSANRVVAADHLSSRNSSSFGRATSRLQEVVGRTAEEVRTTSPPVVATLWRVVDICLV